MRPLSYARPHDAATAVAMVERDPAAAFLAGGTTEVDLLRIGVHRHDLLVDINELPYREVEELPGGGLRLGALSRMSDVARDDRVMARYPAVSQALLLGASEQLRNMATIGGNLCQRVRCGYFRDGISPCNKRHPGTGCAAIDGINRGHAVLGTSPHCIATHPSDLAVALVALDALVHVIGPGGSRAIAIDDFFVLPGDAPQREHPLAQGELIVAVDLPGEVIAARSTYVKVRDRQSYEFALVSVAAALTVSEGVVRDVRLALGGVGTKPWRARIAEAELMDAPATRESYERAAAAELSGADVRRYNAFKVPLAERTIARVLERAS
ncbi:xanthine dehydrogenase family protein subunit M [Phytohabitans sp. ZYX-F-186]|uniref:Xanthine dehydrogenase family protein subunit M n=1 Tax=Phytohabitans maris TaxID=3071409 RepID=A0ABU0ZEA2_9ACTN|nr:xanthine dehydrogenase family protein subunit M [Phytohabitans sp. ZYX-F-186]MDQ7905385.1 xanthine dehydrogenase family protein subunit M [Phytohabitans sp. ZYX-F-186]